MGYRATWHVVRYRYYGLDWDITGLKLTPDKPDPALPTIAIVHGGSANWYEFFIDPLNRAGLGQYLAQRVPVMLITIPGNYRAGGWTEPAFERRVPGYVLDRKIGAEEARLRNAVFTFRLVAEGVRHLLEKTTEGPAGDRGPFHRRRDSVPAEGSSLEPRLFDRSLGWGTGSPASVTKDLDEAVRRARGSRRAVRQVPSRRSAARA